MTWFCFNNVILLDNFSLYVKRIFLLLAFFVFIFLFFYDKVETLAFEVLLLVLLVIFSSVLLLSANDLLLIYLSIELQSLSFYILASSKRDSVLSAEAGIKYFTVGSLASIFLLFGLALLYLVYGTFNLSDILLLNCVNATYLHSVLLLSALFIMVSLFFKLALVPFHNWAPDVYQGSPYVVL